MFDIHVTAWQTHLVEVQASPHLVEPFSEVLSWFFSYLEHRGVRQLAGITPAVVAQWRTLHREMGWQPTHPNRWQNPLFPMLTPPLHVTMSPAERFFAVRCFLRWLQRSAALATDPAAELAALPVPRRLPDWGLTDALVEALLLAPDLATDSLLRQHGAQAWRDRAVLNTLYRHGLSPRRLLALTLASVPVEAFYRPLRPSTQPQVPLTEDPHPWMEVWLQTARPRLVREPTSALFLNADGTPLDAAGLKALVADAAREAGLHRRVSARLLYTEGLASRARAGAGSRSESRPGALDCPAGNR